ncbi:uncharacterized protein BDV14DRAFT_203281 [Aspergillus stella-maris]|uniref:uncharacterized protein n=1 Tax=Aspergillus stella-maris TaxID=1810926 RepID=UPI003CCCA739
MAISHILNKTSPLGEIMRLGHGQRPEIGEPVFYTRYTNVAVACPVPVHQSALANAQEAEIIIENFEWTLVNDGNTSSSQSSKISFAEEPADRRSTNNIIRRLNTPGNPYANVEHPEGYVPRDVVDVLCSYKDVRRQNDHHVNRITKSYHALKTAVRSMRKRAGHKDEE